jgi:hypothetical protein
MAQVLMYEIVIKKQYPFYTKKKIMQHLFKRMSLFAAVSFCAITSFAQDSTGYTSKNPRLFSGTGAYRTWSIGITGGGLGPAVAIGGRNDFNKWKATFGYGAYIKNQLSHRFGLQLEFLKGTVSAESTEPAILPIHINLLLQT